MRHANSAMWDWRAHAHTGACIPVAGQGGSGNSHPADNQVSSPNSSSLTETRDAHQVMCREPGPRAQVDGEESEGQEGRGTHDSRRLVCSQGGIEIWSCHISPFMKKKSSSAAVAVANQMGSALGSAPHKSEGPKMNLYVRYF